eukprot:2202119-Pleurochrysis_carterae.AAC.1
MRCAEVDVREGDDDSQPAFGMQACGVGARARDEYTIGQRVLVLQRLKSRRHASLGRPTHRPGRAD